MRNGDVCGHFKPLGKNFVANVKNVDKSKSFAL
jgi:hypothetical protein